MKGYWHFSALAATASAFIIINGNLWFIIGFFIWLTYLYVFRGLGWLPLACSGISFIFFIFYIPTTEITPFSQSLEIEDTYLMNGIVDSPIRETPSYIQFVFKENESDKKVYIYYFKNQPLSDPQPLMDIKAEYGQTCEIKGKVDHITRPTNPGQFDFREYLDRIGIHGQIIVESLSDIECVGFHPLSFIYLLRRNIMVYIQNRLSDYSFAWLTALIFGEDTFLSDDTVQLFQYWGLSHLLAISGLHVGIVVSLIYFLLTKLNVLTKERAQNILLLFLPVYALLAGGAPSVWRASAMVLLGLLFYKFKARVSMTDIFSLAFIGLLIINPILIHHVGFQLSFIVTFGLLLSKKWLAQPSHPFFTVVKISFVSQMMIVPLQIDYFSIFQPASILLNILVVPYFTLLVIPYMFILLFTSPIPFLGGVLDSLFHFLHDIFMWLIHFIDNVADYPFILGSFPILFGCLYYICFFTMMHRIELKKRAHAFFYGILLVSVLVGLTLKPYLSPEGRITMLDVGQGDSFVIELPYRKAVILYDAGAKVSFSDRKPTDGVYKSVIKPYLYSRGIHKIDAILLSHEDMDHMGSVEFILNDFHVNKIITSRFYENSADIQKKWDKNPTPIISLQKGDRFAIGGQMFSVLSPGYDKGSSNENSLVLYSVFGNTSWLFTGDMEGKTEKDVRNDFPKLKVDVHQVAHHGSNTSTSSDLIQQLNPKYSLISVGRNNVYGHPNVNVLTDIHESGSTILRTDEDGAITFRYKHDRGAFYRFIYK